MDATSTQIHARLRELLEDALLAEGDGPYVCNIDTARVQQVHTLAHAVGIDPVDLLTELRPPHVWLLVPHLFFQCAVPHDWLRRTRLLLCDCLDHLHGAPQPATTMVRQILREADPDTAQALLAVAREAVTRCGLLIPHSPEATLFSADLSAEGVALLVAAALLGHEEDRSGADDVLAFADAVSEADARVRAWLWPRLLTYARADLDALETLTVARVAA